MRAALEPLCYDVLTAFCMRLVSVTTKETPRILINNDPARMEVNSVGPHSGGGGDVFYSVEHSRTLQCITMCMESSVQAGSHSLKRPLLDSLGLSGRVLDGFSWTCILRDLLKSVDKIRVLLITIFAVVAIDSS